MNLKLAEAENILAAQQNHIILPFGFSGELEQAINNLENQDYLLQGLWREKGFSGQRLFTHVARLIGWDGGDEAIGYRFVLEQPAWKKLGLPNRTNQELSMLIPKRVIPFYISGIELFLFETGVGFLNFELTYRSDASVEDVISGNYYAKSFIRRDCKIVYQADGIHQKHETEPITFASLVEKILQPLQVTTYFARHGEKSLCEDRPGQASRDEKSQGAAASLRPFHGLVFTALVLNNTGLEPQQWEIRLKEYLFRLRRSFKESYKPAPTEFDTDANPDVARIFENSYWGVSQEGLANLTYLIEDSQTKRFFEGEYLWHVKDEYYYLYILALHQKYALLTLLEEAARLPRVSLPRTDEEAARVRTAIAGLRRKMAEFVMRCVFRQVSNVTHHGRLYEMMRRSLGIDDMLQELHYELELLGTLAEMEEFKENARLREEQRRQKEIGGIDNGICKRCTEGNL